MREYSRPCRIFRASHGAAVKLWQSAKGVENPIRPSSIAEKAVDRRIVPPRQEAVEGVVCDDTPLVEKKHAVGQGLHVFGMVCDHQDRVAFLLVQFPQERAHAGAHAGIKRCEGLVEQQQGALSHKRAGEGDALALAA